MLEGTRLAALVASKICHDMVEPMNALNFGLAQLKESDTAGRNAKAIAILESGVDKYWAKLVFFRAAFAGGLGGEGDSQLDEIREAAEHYFSVIAPTLEWAAPSVVLPRPSLRVVLGLCAIAAECAGKGGVVRLEAERGEIRLVASAERARLKPDTAVSLRGEEPEHGHQAFNVLPTLIALFARQAGLEILTREQPGQVTLILRSPELRLAAAA